MLLVIDIGNSNIKFGIFDGKHLFSKFSIPTKRDATSGELRSAIGQNLVHPVTGAMICSVVPEIDGLLSELLSNDIGVTPVFITNDFDFGININYEPLADAGTDRLVNTFSAVEKYGVPCIVCSFGTALTVDIVNADRSLVGGLIAPGMNTMAAALKITTAKLPEVEIRLPDSVIQNTTIGSIQAGIVFGYIGLVEKLISKVKEEIGGETKVIATGGFASLIAENTQQIDIVDDNLLLDGMRLLHERIQPV